MTDRSHPEGGGYDWDSLLKDLSTQLHLENDVDLSLAIGITPKMLSAYRSGITELGPLTKLVILDKLGFAGVRNILLGLLPKARAEQLAEMNDQLAKRLRRRRAIEEAKKTE